MLRMIQEGKKVKVYSRLQLCRKFSGAGKVF